MIRAAEAGLPSVEIDIRTTADGIVGECLLSSSGGVRDCTEAQCVCTMTGWGESRTLTKCLVQMASTVQWNNSGIDH